MAVLLVRKLNKLLVILIKTDNCLIHPEFKFFEFISEPFISRNDGLKFKGVYRRTPTIEYVSIKGKEKIENTILDE